jgi:surface antigen
MPSQANHQPYPGLNERELLRAMSKLMVGVTCSVILCGALSCASTAVAKGTSNLAISADSNASDDDVSAIVDVKAEPYSTCAGEVDKAGVKRTLPRQIITVSGAAFWDWRINGHVSAGNWTVKMSCRGNVWSAVRATRFPAAAGLGPGREQELFVPGSLKLGSVKGSSVGRGGGGVRSLYPIGQCTWWVSLLRPDLPWFPGKEGDAANWAVAAEKRHIPTGTMPEEGAVAVFAPGQYEAGPNGHVAYVLSVDSAAHTITVSEYNFRKSNTEDTRTVSSLGLIFIYVPAPPQPESAGPVIPSAPAPPAASATYSETSGGIVHTWTGYANAGGIEGPLIPSNSTVQVTCKVMGFTVEDGNPWWYQVASSPWGNEYFASADAFYNDGATSGSLKGTPFLDPNVPTC